MRQEDPPRVPSGYGRAPRAERLQRQNGRVPTPATPEDQRRVLRQGIVLARVGVVAWAVVVVVAVVLVVLLKPWYLWALLVAFGILRLVLDARRMRTLGRDLEEIED